MKLFLYFLVVLSVAAVTFGRPQDAPTDSPLKGVKKVEGKSEDLRTAASYGFGYGLGFGYPYGYYGYGYGYPGYAYSYGYPYYGYYGGYGYPFYG